MDWLDYREKLGIGFHDSEKVSFFMVKAFNLLDSLNGDYMYTQISETEYFDFCDTTGTPIQRGSIYSSGYNLIIETLHNHSQSLEEFLTYYLAFINCQKDSSNKKWTKEKFKNVICIMLNDSHLSFDIYEDKDGYFIFPKGAQELDDALVSEPLEWLNNYPVAHKAFVKALKAYSNVTEDTASDVADLFRKALESFFQEFFISDKSLENLKSEYGTFLSDKSVPGEIKNNFEKLLELYTKYNNNYAKHHDKTSLNVLEYIMYQTGSLIRLLITLKGV